MADNPRYQQYRDFLRDGGEAMAAALPRIANTLGAQGLDPDVERLLEAIAFNAGKVSERRDRALLEVCELALDILFPHYLAPIPACAIVEFSVDPKMPPHVLPRGSAISSVPVLGTSCRFSTASAVELSGVRIVDVRYRAAPRGGWLDLKLNLAGWREAVGPDRLRLHLHGEPQVTRTLYKGLLAQLRGVSAQVSGRVVDLGHGLSIQAGGLSEEDALLAYPTGSFAGFRLIQEYFAFPEKFLFVDLWGLRRALRDIDGHPEDVSLRFELSADPGEMTVGKEHVRLNCVPVVNLFSHSADPSWRDPRRTELRIRPEGEHLHYEIYRVLGISGRSRGQTMEYPILSDLERSQGQPYAQIFRRAFDGETHFYTMLYDGDALPPEEQVVAVDLLATNGKLPLALGIGDINQLHEPAPGIGARNITALSPPRAPFGGPELKRRLVAHLALGQRDLVELPALNDVVDLYNFGAQSSESAGRAHGLILQSLHEAATELTQSLHKRVPIWGRKTHIVIDEDCYDSVGEVFLLGTVLNEYIALQTPLNHYSEVSVQLARSRESHLWAKRLGRHLLSES